MAGTRKKVIANALFADGAAAVVGASDATAPPEAWRVAATGSCLIPDSDDAMTWTIGDHGFEMTLSRQVPRLIAVHLRPWLEAGCISTASPSIRSARGPSIRAARASSTPWKRSLGLPRGGHGRFAGGAGGLRQHVVADHLVHP